MCTKFNPTALSLSRGDENIFEEGQIQPEVQIINEFSLVLIHDLNHGKLELSYKLFHPPY